MRRVRVGTGRAGLATRILLVVVAALLAWSSVASASPARESTSGREAAPGRGAQEDPPGNGTCERIVRTSYRPVRTIPTPGQGLNYYGDSPPFEGFEPDPRLWTEYCWQSSTTPVSWTGAWTLKTDSFPYDDTNACVTLNPTNGTTPPDTINGLDTIDSLGSLWNGAEPPSNDGFVYYCREGTKWVKGEPPAGTEGQCTSIQRSQLRAPEELSNGQRPEDIGRENSISIDPRFTTEYCFRDGKWVLTEDGFPYDSTSECVEVFYNPDDHDRVLPPATVSEFYGLDELGRIDGQGGITGDDEQVRETYCRNGAGWARRAREGGDDYPQGDYGTWSSECVTIYPSNDTPLRITRNPRELGQDIKAEDFPIGTIDTSKLVTYCKHRDRDVWYRVDNFPLEEALTPEQRERLERPDNGTCVVMDEAPPESLPRLSNPYDWGSFLPLDLWEQANPDDSPPEDRLLCYVLGAWRRGDTLDNFCAMYHNQTPEERDEDLGSVYLIPDGCWGRFPTSQYDIGYDSGSWNHFERKITGWWTGLFFDIGKGATQITLWSVGWAYSFDISRYNSIGLGLGDDYKRNILDNPAFRLLELVWFALIAWAGFTALRGKIAMAGGEILMSIILLALSTVLMLNRTDYMNSAWRLMDEASAELLVAGQGTPPPGNEVGSTDTCLAVGTEGVGAADDDARDRIAGAVINMQRQIHCVFVEQPYDYLNWEKPLTGECAQVRNSILARGPHEADDEPRDLMGAHGACESLVDFNEQPTKNRLIGAVFTMGASLTMAFVMITIALTVVVAKFVALLLFAAAPFAALIAIAPAGGRRMAWLWMTTLFQVIAAVIGTSFLLSVLLLGLERLFMATNNVDLVERFFIMNLLVVVVALGRKRMLAGGASASGRFADNMTNLRLGGGGTPWQGASGSQGVNLLNVDRAAEGARRRVATGAFRGALGVGAAAGAGVGLVGNSIAQRGRERRQAHRALRNLQIMEDYRRGMIEPTFSRTWTLNKDKPKGKGKGGRRKGGGGPVPGGPGGGKPRGGGPGGGKRKGGTPTPAMRPGKKAGPRPAPTPSPKGGPKASPKMSTKGSPKAPPRSGSRKHKRSDSRTASPPYPAPKGYSWDLSDQVNLTGRVPGMNPVEHHRLPRSRLDKIAHPIRNALEDAQDRKRHRRDVDRYNQAMGRFEDWRKTRKKGDYPFK